MSTIKVHYDSDAHAHFIVTLCGTDHGERRGNQSVVVTRTKKKVTCKLCRRALDKQEKAAKLAREIKADILRSGKK